MGKMRVEDTSYGCRDCASSNARQQYQVLTQYRKQRARERQGCKCEECSRLPDESQRKFVCTACNHHFDWTQIDFAHDRQELKARSANGQVLKIGQLRSRNAIDAELQLGSYKCYLCHFEMTLQERKAQLSKKPQHVYALKLKVERRARTSDVAKRTAGGCTRCRVTIDQLRGHLELLHFNHKNPLAKTDDVGRMIAAGRPDDEIFAEIAKCEVLCSPCHRVVTQERGDMRVRRPLRQDTTVRPHHPIAVEKFSKASNGHPDIVVASYSSITQACTTEKVDHHSIDRALADGTPAKDGYFWRRRQRRVQTDDADGDVKMSEPEPTAFPSNPTERIGMQLRSPSDEAVQTERDALESRYRARGAVYDAQRRQWFARTDEAMALCAHYVVNPTKKRQARELLDKLTAADCEARRTQATEEPTPKRAKMTAGDGGNTITTSSPVPVPLISADYAKHLWQVAMAAMAAEYARRTAPSS